MHNNIKYAIYTYIEHNAVESELENTTNGTPKYRYTTEYDILYGIQYNKEYTAQYGGLNTVWLTVQVHYRIVTQYKIWYNYHIQHVVL